MRARQLNLLSHPASVYGGESRKGKRKIRRPIAVKSPMHVVFRSTRARGPWSFTYRANEKRVRALADDVADRFSVRIRGFANVGNHLHLVVQVKHRRNLQAFLRVFGQRLMFLVTGAKKGSPRGRFFDAVAFSRIVTWGRDFKRMENYIFKNTLEALGLDRSKAKDWLRITPDGIEPCG
jgi:hypothetical protein